MAYAFFREEKGLPLDGGATTSSQAANALGAAQSAGAASFANATGTTAARPNTVNSLNGQAYSQRYHTLYKKRILLPVFEYRSDFMRLLAENQCIVLVGEVS